MSAPSKFFLLAAALVLALVAPSARAQGDGGFDTIANLPSCAQPCASAAATLVNCKLTDLACLCAAPGFTNAVESCAFGNGVCPRENLAAVSSIVNGLCVNVNTTSSSSPASSATGGSTSSSGTPGTTSSHSTSPSITGSTTTSNTGTSRTSTSTSTLSTPTPAATTATVSSTTNAGTLALATTLGAGAVNSLTSATSDSSTVVVVATVTLPQTSALSGATVPRVPGLGAALAVPVVFGVVGWVLAL